MTEGGKGKNTEDYLVNIFEGQLSHEEMKRQSEATVRGRKCSK